jgi:hypothetical protein
MKEGTVRGTIVCGVTDGDEGHAALERGVELSQRLGLRLGRGSRRRNRGRLTRSSLAR